MYWLKRKYKYCFEVLATEGDRLLQCGIVQGKREFSEHHCMSGVCDIEHYICDDLVVFKL